MKNLKAFLAMLLVGLYSTSVFAADTNTVSSTVVTDKAPPTASAPSIVINNSDVCKSAYSAALQTGFAGIATGNPIQAGVAGGTLATTQALQNPQVQKRIAKQIADLVAKRGAKAAAKFMPGVDVLLSVTVVSIATPYELPSLISASTFIP